MNKFATYSVLMSVYYKEKPEYLMESIESILNQSILTDDFIIVKDGPLTEELDSMLKSYSEKFPFISLVSLKENVGLGLALNAGLDICKNELVARMDSDDISLPNRCEHQLNMFNLKSKLTILGTQIAEFYTTPKDIISIRQVPTKFDEIITFSRRRSPFNHPTVMYKKSEIIKLGGYKDVRRKEDLELFLNALNNGYYSENLDEIGLFFRSNEDNYLRRKDKINCISYIKTIYTYYQEGYCKFSDLLYVVTSQIFFMIAPKKLMQFVSDKYLRRKITDE
ncbi:glycosyltransferase [Enterococcus massiliensis]|uniref:glycosyltransferase n=1 Tax=Enterococcus massiliensis TaxID=1640685 RepID=UPI00065DD89D|nr:glycosyltransferase [Enterococcus massiliensis]